MRKILVLFGLIFSSVLYAQNTLHIYGGKNNTTYLGCLNCTEYDADSIWNKNGKYGNKYSAESIWNEQGTYGNQYSAYSPWNENSNDNPIIVDKKGDFYGYLAANKYRSNRVEFELALAILRDYKQIGGDISGWYAKNSSLIKTAHERLSPKTR